MSTSKQGAQGGIISGSVFDAAVTTPVNKIGRRCEFLDGRVFHYCSTVSDISVGDLVSSLYNSAAIVEAPIPATRFGVDTSTAPAAGSGGSITDTTIAICVLSGTTAITANQYANGFLNITDATGEGYYYSVEKNDANAATGTSNITIRDGLTVALDNTSVGLLQVNEFQVATHTAANYGGDPNQLAVGRAMVASTAGTDSTTEYIWVQTWGRSLLQSGTAVASAGEMLYPAEDDNGSVQAAVAGEEYIQQVGIALVDGTDEVWQPCLLRCIA